MGVITKLAIRNMRRRKARYILTTLTLVIGVALFGGILIANDSFQVTFINDIDRRMGTADILLRDKANEDGWFNPKDLDSIEGLDHITDIAYRISGFDVFITSVEGGSRDENSTLSAIYGIDPDSKDEADLGGTLSILDSDVKGKTLEDLLGHANDHEIVITESLKIKLHNDFKAGDYVHILPIDYEKSFPESEHDLIFSDSSLWPKYKVLAIVRDNGEARDFDPDTPEEFSSPSRGPCIFTSIDTAHDLVDGQNDYKGRFNLAAIGVDDLNIIKTIIHEIEHKLDDDNWVAADLKTDSINDINNSMTMMRTMFLMFALVALILSIILILNIFNIIKEEQEYETGMLQAIGSSKAETFRMFLTQGLLMGVIGAIIGTIGSYFMSYFIFWMTIESLKNLPGQIGEYFAGFEFSIILLPETIALTLAIGVISCILASIYPSWKASRKPIIECLNPLAQKTKREKKHFIRKILTGLFASLLVIYGSYLLFTVMGEQGRGMSQEASTISMVAPTLILLGIIGIMNLFVSPFTRVFIKLFSPYLKHTTLLTRKNVLRNRKRTVLTFSMIALTMSYLIGLSVFMGSMDAGVQTTVNDIMGCDVRIFSYGTSLEFSDKLESRDGVDEVMGVTYQNVQIWDDDRGKWIGHGLLEKEWDISITANVVEDKMMKKRMAGTEVIDPSDKTFDKVMNDLSDEYTVMIPIEVADRFDLKEGDTMQVKLSLGIVYPTLHDMIYRVEDTAVENSIEVELKVIGVVDNVQGFGFSNLIGQDVESYSFFISWNTWEAISLNNLPGGGTDIMVRQMTQSGERSIDIVQSNWFNFSDVIGALDNVSGIEYYTTRMDYFSPTYDLNNTFDSLEDLSLINFDSSVVGIRTNSSGKLVDDSYFGQNQLIEKSSAYDGLTMEELLNGTSPTDKVCVVDQTFVNNMRLNNTDFGINSTISIFPQLFKLQPEPIYVGSFDYPFYYAFNPFNPLIFPRAATSVTPTNGTLIVNPIYTGYEEETITTSDAESMIFISNKSNLEVIIDVNMTAILGYYMHYLSPYNITFESSVNSTVDLLNLEVLNYYTGKYDKLGNINNTISEANNTFTFNQEMPAFSYINQSNNILRLRISGQNSTYDSDFELNVDSLSFLFFNSSYSLNASTWPTYKVIGIIQDPTLAMTERALWSAEAEKYYDVDLAKNTVYINYEDARNEVYPMNKGNLVNGTDDKITSILIHCNNIEQIKSINSQLKQELNDVEDSVWTSIDFKTPTLESRRYVYDWYIWILKGYDDEDVLADLIEFIEDEGYIVMFGFTRTFVEDMFKGMISLIVMITTGVLTFAVIIAMIGLALHSLLSTMARRREIGMLRSIGLNKKGVIRTVSGETIIISLLGALIGILAGLLQGFLMVAAVPDTGLLTVTFTIPWLTIGILVGVTIATAIISSRYPSRWAANINIIDAVRTR
jgi:ABC-type lipoprotein release transport system permease subunit